MATNDETVDTGQPGVVRPHISHDELRRWFQYHAPSGQAINLHQEVRQALHEVASYFNSILPEGPSKTLSLRALEQSMFHANAAVARDPSLHDRPTDTP